MFKKIIFLICTFCCFNIFTMYNAEQLNKEEIHTLRRSRRSLRTKLQEVQEMKQRAVDALNTLKQEQSLTYHINKAFKAVYGPIPKSTGKFSDMIDTLMLPWEVGRLAIAYGLFPITATLTTAYAASEWRSKKENNDKILMYQKVITNNESEEKKIQSEIDDLEKLIKEVSNEQ